jgi:hypothetical protein
MAIDEFAGEGGTYLLDPKSGKRKLVLGSRTLDADQPLAVVDEQPAQSDAPLEVKTNGNAA